MTTRLTALPASPRDPLDPNSPNPSTPLQDSLYEEVVATFGPALVRLARAHERDDDRRQDLLQDIHFAIWRSLAIFDGRCTLRTWVYRIAHNAAASHVLRDRRRRSQSFVGLEELDDRTVTDGEVPDARIAEHLDLEHRRSQLTELLERLAPLDRQLMLLYLEGCDATVIGEVTGLSSGNVATKVHRIKRVLAALARQIRIPPASTGAAHVR